MDICWLVLGIFAGSKSLVPAPACTWELQKHWTVWLLGKICAMCSCYLIASLAFLLVLCCVAMTYLFKDILIVGICLFREGWKKRQLNVKGLPAEQREKKVELHESKFGNPLKRLGDKRCSMVMHWWFSSIYLDDVVVADLQLDRACDRTLSDLLPWQNILYIKETK